MKSLAKFIDQQNRFAVYFKTKTFDANNLSASDVEELASQVSSDLSPEALTCDGELSTSAVRAKLKFLTAVKADIEKLGGVVREG